MTTLIVLLLAVAQPPAEKVYTIAFEGVPWANVFDWFAKESGLVLIATEKPTGTVTIRNAKKMTLPEVIDVLNTSLAYNQFRLQRINATSFVVVSAAESMPDSYIPRVKPGELSAKGRTEVVQVEIELKGFTASEILDQVKQRLTVFGKVEAVGEDRLLVTDLGGTIRQLVVDLQRVPPEDSLTYRCRSIRAADAAGALTKLLGDKFTKVIPMGSPKPADDGRTRVVEIAVVEKLNGVILAGPADKLATAEKLLKELDVAPLPAVLPTACPPPCRVAAPACRPRLLARLRR